ncbi:hypothetical protein SNEBB_011256 [Seison nebaliae]|nr:hypothetical protein SNEBB_011256 [Seison nebaliae]
MEFEKPYFPSLTVDDRISIEKKEDAYVGKETEANCLVKFNKNHQHPIEEQRRRLPIYQKKKEFLYVLEKNDIVIVCAETGSGKSTQLPQYLYENNWTTSNENVCILQSQSLIAMSLAKRIGEEMNSVVGNDIVGYMTESHVNCRYNTSLQFMTYPLIMREMMKDPLLRRYSIIFIDDIHERILFTDIILSLLYLIKRKRPHLRIIITSATMNVREIENFFKEIYSIGIVECLVRSFEIDIKYLGKPTNDYVKEMTKTIFKLHVTSPLSSHILAFLPTIDEIELVEKDLRFLLKNLSEENFKKKYLDCPPNDDFIILQFHSGLSLNEQVQIFRRSSVNCRKIVLTTNYAETSITIPDITIVIDSGYVRTKIFNYKLGMELVKKIPISQSIAKQRAGRCGRTRSGVVYRLYTEETYDRLIPFNLPQIQRLDISMLILYLQKLSIKNIIHLRMLSQPPLHLLSYSLKFLYSLNSIDDHGLITDHGKSLLLFPSLNPSLSTTLLSSIKFNCLEEILTIIAFLQIDNNIFVSSKRNLLAVQRCREQFASQQGDHITYLNIYEQYKMNRKSNKWCHENFLKIKLLNRVDEIRNNLKKILIKFNFIPTTYEKSSQFDVNFILKSLASGLFQNVGRRNQFGMYHLLSDERFLFNIHPNSVFDMSLFQNVAKPKYILFNQILQSNRLLAKHVSWIDEQILLDIAPTFFKYR